MTTLLLTHDACGKHDPGPTHPESRARLQAVLNLLRDRPVDGAVFAEAQRATVDDIARVHARSYVEHILAIAGRTEMLDGDTITSADTTEASLRAAGACVSAVNAVLDGTHENAFALVRPPGHHAIPSGAMGFCVFNNVAIAAEQARARGLQRILCVDWDVHHGNGTEDAFYARSDVLFMSTHRHPFYPGTGTAERVGAGEGTGFNINVPLPSRCDDGDFAAIFNDVLLPIAHAYKPELVLVSAGFDAHAGDPLGDQRLSEDGFAALCGAVKRVAEEHCQGRLVLTLEGGYDVQALARSVHACVAVMAGATAPSLRGEVKEASQALREVSSWQRKFWKSAL